MRVKNRATPYHLVTACILLAGFGAAIAIYMAADAPVADPLAEFAQSKRYTHNLELNGGRFAVAANDFRNWFAGLWKGEELAFTVAWITVIIAIAYFLAASRLEQDARNGNNQD